RHIEGVSNETMDRLVKYPWPGNVRELQNVIERAVVLSTGSALKPGPDFLPVLEESHPHTDDAPLAGSPPPPLSLREVERRHIEVVLAHTSGVVDGAAGAARILDLHPNTLRSRMKKLGVSAISLKRPC